MKSTLEALSRAEAVSLALCSGYRVSGVFCATLPWPPSVNRLWRRVGNKTLLSAEGRHYHEIVGASVAILMTRMDVPPAPHTLTLVYTLPDRRKRDLDNLLKAVIDPVYRAFGMDDSVIEHIDAMKQYRGAGAGSVTIEVRTVEVMA